MNTRQMVQTFFLLALSLILLAAWTAPTSEPVTRSLLQDDLTPTVVPDIKVDPSSTPQPTATLESTATPTAVPVAMVQPGSNPDVAQVPTGTWQFIPPGATRWYKMYVLGLQLDVWLDANRATGLSLAIYAPDQTDLYGKPIGRGSFNKFIQEHDLYWTGASSAGGYWYAVVTNSSQATLPYLLNYKRTVNSVAGRCSECHGFEIEWDRCVDHGSDFCENLQQEYQQK